MSDDQQKPGKILRTSGGPTRLTAGGSKTADGGADDRTAAPQVDDRPAAPLVEETAGREDQAAGAEAQAGDQTAALPAAGAQPAGAPAEAPAARSEAPAVDGAGTRDASEVSGAGASNAGAPGTENGSRSSGPSNYRLGSQPKGEAATRVVPQAADVAEGGEANRPPKKQVRIAGPNSKAANSAQPTAGAGETRVQPAVGQTERSQAGADDRATRGSQPDGRASGSAAGRGASAAAGAVAGATAASAGRQGHSGVTRTAGQGTRLGSGPRGGDGIAAGHDGEGVRASSSGVKMTGGSKKKGPRTVKLTVAKIDPWSVMKMTFLLSLALGIATVVASLVLWLVLQATGTLQNLQSTLGEIAGTESADQLLSLFGLGRILSFSIILAVVNIVLMTALSTLFAFLYNIGASIVGGFHLTLSDD